MSLKEKLETKIPPPVYGLLSAMLMWWLNHLLPDYAMPGENLLIVGGAIMLAGFSMDLAALKLFMGKHTTVNPLSPGKASTLVISGLYHFTRNPMYLGLLMVLFGWGLFLSNLATLIVLPLFIRVLTQMQILPEERILLKKFGQPYADYLKQVRRWM